jgi:hypothetical protein
LFMTYRRVEPDHDSTRGAGSSVVAVIRQRDQGQAAHARNCTRCGRRRSVVSQRRALWLGLRALWFVLAFVAVALFTVETPMIIVLFPALFCFFFAIAPLNALASASLLCRTCQHVMASDTAGERTRAAAANGVHIFS